MTAVRPKIIIFTDSRGRGLQEFINNHPESGNYDNIISILPGNDLNQISVSMTQVTNALPTDNYFCVVFAGICGLTERSNNDGIRKISYPLDSRDIKTQSIITTIQDLNQRFANKITVCTIIPASLHKHFALNNPNQTPPTELEAEQAALLEDIETINTHIIQSNTGPNININLSKRFHRQIKKKRQKTTTLSYRRLTRFSDKELPDGVHLSNAAKSICFNLIYNSAIRNLNLQLAPSSAAEETSQTSSQDDSDADWDFKRKPSADNRPVTCIL